MHLKTLPSTYQVLMYGIPGEADIAIWACAEETFRPKVTNVMSIMRRIQLKRHGNKQSLFKNFKCIVDAIIQLSFYHANANNF